jgi:pimeloyl-ACP methyl ester carboxylesterase
LKEDDVLVGCRKVHYRVVGDAKKEKKAGVLPLLCLGEAGLSMDALEPIELIAQTQRRVIRIDALGSGDSDPLAIDSAPTRGDLILIAAIEARAILDKLGLGSAGKPLHLFCVGFGAEVASALASGNEPIAIASVAVEPVSTQTPPLLPASGKSLPVCVEDGFARGNAAIVDAAAIKSSVASISSAAAKLAVLYPVLWIVAEASPSATPPVVPSPMERSSNSIKEVTFAHGDTGTPHVDDANIMTNSLDGFYLEVENELRLGSKTKK